MRFTTKQEIETAINETRQDLFRLEAEIGREAYLQIFDEYNPAQDEDEPHALLMDSLFGNSVYDEHWDFHILAEEYILDVWERTNKIARALKPRKWKLQNQWRKFRTSILERDDYKCQECGSNKNLCAHHIKARSEYPELTYDPSNVLTLCKQCHAKVHPEKASLILGKGNSK